MLLLNICQLFHLSRGGGCHLRSAEHCLRCASLQLPTAVIQDLIRSNQHPFELQGIAHLLPRVQQQIAQLLVHYHRAFGSYLSYAQDAVPKDKHAQVALFSAVIRLIPYFKPEQWSVVRPLDLLPS